MKRFPEMLLMEYRDFAVHLAKQAGVIIKKNFFQGMETQWKLGSAKIDISPVTASDLEINALVIAAVKECYPGHSIYGEENSDMIEGSEFVWVCDPVDGTLPFSHGVPTCVFSLALTHHGMPVLSVIHDPFLDRLFVAEKGKGATMNGKPIHVNETEGRTAVVGYEITSGGFERHPHLRDALHKQGFKILSVGSTIYDGMLVASGNFAASVFGGITGHDGATVKLLVEEAGGRVTALDGSEQRYDGKINGLLASNGKIHDELLAIIAKNRQ
jgi:myo-inositol-1(or 4)-monophosphatase